MIKNWYLFRLFLKEMKIQRKRIMLTISAIAWGTLSIILLLSFGEGLKRQMSITEKGLGINIVIVNGGQTGKVYQGLPKGRQINFTGEDVELLKKEIPEITRISGEYDYWGASFNYGKTTLTDRFTGVLPSFEDMRTHYPDAGGRFINKIDIEQSRRVIFLGDELKQRLIGDEPAVGKTIKVNNIPFTVIGVMKNKMQMSMYNGPDAGKASIPFTTFKSLFGRRHLSRIVYQVEHAESAPFVKKEVFRVLGRKYRFDPDDNKALFVWDTIENSKIVKLIMDGIQLFLGVIGALTLLIASIGVANTMYVSVKERTREIGVKRAIGANRAFIKSQIVSEAFFIALAGGLIGGMIALFIIKILQGIPVAEGPLQFLGKPTFSLPIALATTIILGIVGLASGYFPARRASKIEPVEALRYE